MSTVLVNRDHEIGAMWMGKLQVLAVTPGNQEVENSGLGKPAILQILGHPSAPTNNAQLTALLNCKI